MSNEFDNELFKLYETGVTSTPIQLDEYEKSVYLTKAQEAIVDSLYAEYDSTELVRRQLHKLVCKSHNEIMGSTDFMGYSKYNVSFDSMDIKAILQEYATLSTDCSEIILYGVPIKQDELIKVLKNPFRCPNDNRVLRIEDTGIMKNITLLCKKFNLTKNVLKYDIIYLRNPKPIILTKLNNITISGTDVKSTSIDLSADLHRKIIDIAVTMVLAGLNNKKSNKDT